MSTEQSFTTTFPGETVVSGTRNQHADTATNNDTSYPLDIRTMRIFAYIPEQGGWRQVHHHGSIDSAERLDHYVQTALDGLSNSFHAF